MQAEGQLVGKMDVTGICHFNKFLKCDLEICKINKGHTKNCAILRLNGRIHSYFVSAFIFKHEHSSLCIYHFSCAIDFSSEKYIVSTGHRYSWYQQRRYSEDADGETRTRVILTVSSLPIPGVPVSSRNNVLRG